MADKVNVQVVFGAGSQRDDVYNFVMQKDDRIRDLKERLSGEFYHSVTCGPYDQYGREAKRRRMTRTFPFALGDLILISNGRRLRDSDLIGDRRSLKIFAGTRTQHGTTPPDIQFAQDFAEVLRNALHFTEDIVLEDHESVVKWRMCIWQWFVEETYHAVMHTLLRKWPRHEDLAIGVTVTQEVAGNAKPSSTVIVYYLGEGYWQVTGNIEQLATWFLLGREELEATFFDVPFRKILDEEKIAKVLAGEPWARPQHFNNNLVDLAAHLSFQCSIDRSVARAILLRHGHHKNFPDHQMQERMFLLPADSEWGDQLPYEHLGGEIFAFHIDFLRQSESTSVHPRWFAMKYWMKAGDNPEELIGLEWHD